MAALREMRVMSHLSGLLKLLSRSTGDMNDVFSGYVWVEEGKIVGNITVQRADSYGNRWQIANVAVASGLSWPRDCTHTYASRTRPRGRRRWSLGRVPGLRPQYGRTHVVRAAGIRRRGRDGRAGVGPAAACRDAGAARRFSAFYATRLAAALRAGDASTQCTSTMVALAAAQRFSAFVGAAVLRMDVADPGQAARSAPLHPGCASVRGRGRAHRGALAGRAQLDFGCARNNMAQLESYLVQWALAVLQEYPRAPVKTTIAMANMNRRWPSCKRLDFASDRH